MSAQPQELVPELDEPTGEDLDGGDERLLEPAQVEVRRNAVASALLGAAASAVAIAYLWRAVGSGSVLDWVLCASLGLLGALFLHSLLDARSPLLVADEMGVRIRLGATWRGLPWDAIERVLVRPRRGLLRDGALVVQLSHVARTIEGLEGRARRHATVNRKLYGGALAVPLGLGTRTDGSDDELSNRIATLSQGRAEVVTLLPAPPESAPGPEVTEGEPTSRQPEPQPDDDAAAPEDVSGEADPVAGEVSHEPAADAEQVAVEAPDRSRRRWLRRHAPAAGSAQPDTDTDTDTDADAGTDIDTDTDTGGSDDVPDASAAPGMPEQRSDDHRATQPRRGDARAIPLRASGADDAVTVRVEPVEQVPPRGARAFDAVGTVREAVNPVGRNDSKVRAIAKLGDPVAPLVIDDYQPEPAYDPVIGPELAASRTRVGLTVDELADRTRIRPHVIESIEVDDFAPCGGDFYARGHIRTLSRVLGKDPVPLLELYEVRYAHAPVSARKVFEAEMATGMGGHMARPYGGPNWTGLVATVLLLVLVWAGVRLFAGDGGELLEEPPPVLDGSAGLSSYYGDPTTDAGPAPVTAILTAVNGDAEVEVRDGDNNVVHDAELVIGEVKRLRVVPPVTVTSDDGGAVTVQVGGRDEGFLGVEGAPATRTFGTAAAID